MDSPSLMQDLVSRFQGGGFWMIPIAICLAVSVALAVERFVRLFLHYNVDGASFMFEIQKYVLTNDIDGAIRICNGAGNAVLPKVVKAGLQRSNRDAEQIQNAVDAMSLEAVPKLERRLPYLALVANIATLMGLLGTISGLITSFGSLEKADPAQRQAILSHGISEAMNATAFGLITAIFSMIAHSILANRAQKVLEEIDEYGVKLIDLLSARKYKGAKVKEEAKEETY